MTSGTPDTSGRETPRGSTSHSDSPNLSDPEYSGVVAVCAGLVALTLIAIVAIVVAHDSSSSVASIATGAGGVIGSVVGAFFGVKSGSSNTKAAISAQSAESARAQTFAAHLDPDKADELIDKLGLADAAKAQ